MAILIVVILLAAVLVAVAGQILWRVSRGGTKERLVDKAAGLIEAADRASKDGRPALAESYMVLYEAVLRDIREYDALERPRD